MQQNHNPDLVTDNGDKTTFNQQPSSKEEKASTFIPLSGYPQGKRSSDTEGINCSEVTGNGKYYM
jgi:hypothetical protein